MAQLDELLLQQNSAYTPELAPTIPSVRPVTPEPQGFFKNVYDSAGLNWFSQAVESHRDFMRPATKPTYIPHVGAQRTMEPIPNDPTFNLEDYLRADPLKIRWAHKFENVYSKAAADNVWNHIQENLAAEERLANSEAFISRMVGEMATPDIFLPVGGIRRGVGFVEGVLRGAGVGLPTIAANEAFQLKYNPTATLDQAKEDLLYGTAMFGLLGGGVGMLRSGQSASKLATSMAEESRRIAGTVTPDGIEEPILKSISQTEGSGFRPYIATPTESTPTGFAPAFGLEKIASRQSGWSRAVNSGVRAYEDLANRFFGDHSVLFARNKNGIATEPSAFLASEGWLARAGDAILDIKNYHANYLTDGVASAEVAGLNVRSSLASLGDKVRKVTGRQRMDGKLRADEFERAVFDTYIGAQKTGLIDHPIPQVKEAALRLQKFFKEFADEGYKTNYLKGPEHINYLTRIKNEFDLINQQINELSKVKKKTLIQANTFTALENHAQKLKKELYPLLRRDELKQLINEKEIKINDLERNIRTDKQYTFYQKLTKEREELIKKLNDIENNIKSFSERKPLSFYFPHRWDAGAVVKNEEKLRNILINHFTNTARNLGYSGVEDAVRARVDAAIDNILKRGDMAEDADSPFKAATGDGRAFFTRSRQIDIPTELIAEFIDTDLVGVMREYARKAGLGIEYTRAFDSPDGELAIGRASIQAAKEGKTLSQITEIEGDIRNVRDAILGRVHSPEQIGAKEANILRSWFTLTSMGRAIFANLAEVVRPMWVLGVQENFDYILKSFGNNDVISGMTDELRKNTSGYWELALGMTHRRFVDSGPDTFGSMSKYGRAVESVERPLSYFAGAPFYLLNGVGVLTHFLKNYTGLVAAEMVGRRALAVKAGTASAKDIEFLASYGISMDDAIRIAEQPIQRDKGLLLANTMEWTDKASVTKFFNAIEAIQRRTIVTPSAADKPSIMMGMIGKGATRKESVMLSLPFQLKAWSFGANNKVVLSALQGRDASVMAGMLGMYGIAYLGNAIKTPDAVWKKQDQKEKLLSAFESSGIAALYGDLNFMAETASQNTIGIRPTLGMKPKFGQENDGYDAIGELAGPSFSKAIDIYKAFNEGAPRDKARVIVNSVPLNNLFWIPNSFRAMARKSLEEVFQ